MRRNSASSFLGVRACLFPRGIPSTTRNHRAHLSFPSAFFTANMNKMRPPHPRNHTGPLFVLFPVRPPHQGYLNSKPPVSFTANVIKMQTPHPLIVMVSTHFSPVRTPHRAIFETNFKKTSPTANVTEMRPPQSRTHTGSSLLLPCGRRIRSFRTISQTKRSDAVAACTDPQAQFLSSLTRPPRRSKSARKFPSSYSQRERACSCSPESPWLVSSLSTSQGRNISLRPPKSQRPKCLFAVRPPHRSC